MLQLDVGRPVILRRNSTALQSSTSPTYIHHSGIGDGGIKLGDIAGEGDQDDFRSSQAVPECAGCLEGLPVHFDGHAVIALLLHVRYEVSFLATLGPGGLLGVLLLTGEESELLQEAVMAGVKGVDWFSMRR